ncbi:MAG: amino acid adenylation domain-containing protein, partial [Chloroflexi bacterium]|nr:amino acid adenylation domain-containing protein [Chloroflexota bacterium]
HRYTGQDDILLGSPLAGRSRAELSRIVGYFINPVVLRSDLGGNPAFKEFLGRVRGTVLGALEHEDFPFPLLVERLQPRRDASRSPLFQVAFIWDKLPQPEEPGEAAARQDGRMLDLEPIAVGQRGAPFDLTLTVAEGSGSLTASFQYNTDLFDAERIVRMSGHLRTLLEGVAADPEQRLSELPLLTDAERHQMLAEWNDTRSDYPADARLHDLFEAQVQRTPEAIAVVFEGDSLTYRELNRRANQLANYLRTLSVEPEDRVGLCVERSLEMAVGLLGILKAGAAYVPMDPAFPKVRLNLMWEDCGASVLLTHGQALDNLPRHAAHVVSLDGDSEAIARESADNPAGNVTPDNLAYVIYTSGSTGKPKGVQITHRAVVNLLHAMRAQPGLSERDVLLAVTSLSFDIAALEIFLPLTVGARLVVASRQVTSDGVRLMEMLAQCGATVMQATPATWRLLLEAGWQGDRQLKILCGGEALPRDLANQLLERGAALWNLYGPTETTIWSTVHPVAAGSWPVPIGRPIANTHLYLLDANLNPVPVGVPGELHIGGLGLARGYLNLPDLTAERFISNPFLKDEDGEKAATFRLPPSAFRLYKTGDVALYLPDGNIEFLGRVDHQVKVRGFRIELEEIETRLRGHPAVREAVVVARDVEGAPGDKRLVAYLVPDRDYVQSRSSASDSNPSPSELRRFLTETLPDYMTPAHFVILDAMPLTPNGKVDRLALPAPDRARPALDAAFVAPRTPVEKLLAEIWSQVLGVETVGAHDNFFELGGASIQVLQIVAQAGEAGLTFKPESFFVHQTIAELAHAAVSGGDGRSRDAADPPNMAALSARSDSREVRPAHFDLASAADATEPPPAKPGNTIIESLGVYLPAKVVTTKEVLAAGADKILFPLEQLTGIKSRRIAGDSEFSIDLAKKAVETCLANSKYTSQDLDLLICCNVSRCDGPNHRFSFEPNTAIRLRKHFGFDRALAFDVANACPGMFTAIMIVDAFLKAGLIQCGMVVSGEYITHLTQTAQKEIDEILDSRMACLTLGDAGAALILEASPDDKFGFHDLDLYTLGRYYPLCVAKQTEHAHGGAIMHTDSIKLTSVTIEQAVAHSGQALGRAGWQAEGIQHVIMHQTSKTSLNDAAREINRFFDKQVCGDDNVVYNLAERGNTATTSHFVAVMDKIRENKIKPGDRALFSVTGSGLTVGTALYTFDDLPDRLRRVEAAQERPAKAGAKKAPPRPRRLPRIRIESAGVIPEERKVNREAIELAKIAAENCLEESSYSRSDIGLLLYAGVYRNDFLSEPAVAAIVAGEMGINDSIQTQDDAKTLAFDVFNGALGFLNACYIARQMIGVGRFKTAMIVASEIENNATVVPDRLVGLKETGSAVILDEAPDGKTGFGSFVFRYFADHIDAFTAYTALLNGRTFLQWSRDPRIEDYYLECIPGVVRELLDAEGLDVSQIKLIFPPQISSTFIPKLSDRINVAKGKFVDVTRDGQDYYTSSLPYAFRHAREQGLVEAGDVGLIVSVGAGIQVGCATYYF